MAQLSNKTLFFTTSPRSPEKMIPEISLLTQKFEGKIWNKDTQNSFANELSNIDFFKGAGSLRDKSFSARDRITRAPKSLGFVNLSPSISLTEAGREFVFGKRPQEIFLAQLLKFQLPSPYHTEPKAKEKTFNIRPYLEIFRLIRELEYLTFDEMKIFAIQLTDYRDFQKIKKKILDFRDKQKKYAGNYKKFIEKIWEDSIRRIYKTSLSQGKTKTRESADTSLKKFIFTKKSNSRDYADACFRYLRYTGLVSMEHKNRKISFFQNKLDDVDFFLSTVPRKPVFITDETNYKNYLFCPKTPALYCNIKENIVASLLKSEDFSKQFLEEKSLEELKDLRDSIIQKKKEDTISSNIEKIKNYELYDDIMKTYNDVIRRDFFDAPLMFEFNTWRAMTMLDGGEINGNLLFDDAGQPMSTAPGNRPDIECNYGDFVLAVEVTLQNGQRQYETEGEPVARHFEQLKKTSGKDAYCLFIAPTINPASLVHFFNLNKINNFYYGGKTKIIPLSLEQFRSLLKRSYDHKKIPCANDLKKFLDSVITQIFTADNEIVWQAKIQQCIDTWLLQDDTNP